MSKTKPDEISDYISDYPKDVQVMLKQLRITIRKAAPEAVEVISYKMPAFKYNGMLVWYAAHKTHIGFYPRKSGIQKFKQGLLPFKMSVGAVQFPYNKPLPLKLITKIVEFRVKENSKS